MALPAWARPDWKSEGERLTFKVGLGFVTAGKAEVLFEPTTEKYRITSRAWTNEGVESFYVMRDRVTVEGAFANGEFLTNSYQVELNENDYRADKKVTYDRSAQTASYQNLRAKEAPKVYDIMPNTRDLLSALYYLRLNQKHAKAGDVFKLPLFDLERQYRAEIRVLEREELHTIFGKIPTLKLQFYMRQVGGDKVKDDWSMWITDDAHYTPVRLKVSLPFGSFGARLIDIAPADSTSHEPKGFKQTGPIKVPPKRRSHANPLGDD